MAIQRCSPRLLIALAALLTQAAAATYEKPAPFASFHALSTPTGAAAAAVHSRSARSLRVVDGNEAAEKQFPHQVGLYVDLSTFCGGALISPQWILTAATCAGSNPRARYTAFLGAHNINLPAEKHRIAVTTTQSYVPKTFDSKTFRDDVGLILLPRAVRTSDYIKPIALPSPDFANQTFAGTKFQLSGWGYRSDGAASISPTLQYAALKGADKKTCVDTYSYEIYTDKLLCCVGATDKQSPCQGDTGGALVKVETDGSMTHVAVASFTPSRGCSTGKPSGFTRTASYLDWIASIVDA